MSKTCTKCRREKSESLYQIDHQKKDSLSSSCKECRSITRRDSYVKNKDKENAGNTARYHKNRKSILAKQRKRGADPEVRKRKRVYSKQHYRDNKDYYFQKTAARRARKAGIPSEPVSREEVFKRDNGTCKYCGVRLDPERWEIDHVIPISRIELSPTHTYSNVVASCRDCNRAKKNRTPDEWKR